VLHPPHGLPQGLVLRVGLHPPAHKGWRIAAVDPLVHVVATAATASHKCDDTTQAEGNQSQV